jgi:hypothetical protein
MGFEAVLVMALKHCCLDSIELARRIARFPVLNPEFGPFKDYLILEREAHNEIGFNGHNGAGKFMTSRKDISSLYSAVSGSSKYPTVRV